MLDLNWWNGLERQWKDALGVAFFRHSNIPSLAEIEQLYASPALRLAGPKAPYPNMAFEINNLSGISGLHNLEILVITHHQVKDISPIKELRKLKSLFLFNNEIESLQGIEELINLEQLYVQFNKIDSIKPLQGLTNLKEVYINNNLLTSLEGLTEEHGDNLTTFFCKPNDGLKQKELVIAENHLGIKCRSL